MRDIKVGDIIITNGPYVTSPKPEMFKRPLIAKVTDIESSGTYAKIGVLGYVVRISNLELYNEIEEQNFENWIEE